MGTKTSRRAWSAFAAITVLTGCAAARQDPSAISTKNERVTVQIENYNWQDVAVWARSGGTRIRLGTVTTGSTSRFRLPATLAANASNVQLEGHRIGSNDLFTSDPFQVSPGTHLVWRLENQLGLSSQYIQSGR